MLNLFKCFVQKVTIFIQKCFNTLRPKHDSDGKICSFRENVSILPICILLRAVGPSLAVFLEPLAHRQNVASLILFYRYYFGKFWSELAQLIRRPYSLGRSNCYSDRLHDFCVTIPRCYKDVYVNSSFPSTARPWNSPFIECFSFTFDLNGCKSRINRHLLTVISF